MPLYLTFWVPVGAKNRHECSHNQLKTVLENMNGKKKYFTLLGKPSFGRLNKISIQMALLTSKQLWVKGGAQIDFTDSPSQILGPHFL